MANDLFGRQQPVFGGAFAADSALLAFSGITGVGLLTQQITIGYQYNLSRIYEVGTHYQYYVVGRASGSVSLNRVLGPRPLIFAFYSTYGNPCNAATNTIDFSMQQGCIAADDPTAQDNLTTISMLGVVLQSVNFSTAAEQMMVNEQSSGLFVALLPPAV